MKVPTVVGTLLSCGCMVLAKAGCGRSTMHSVPEADLSVCDYYEINLDQRILDPEICMAA
eukprot:COSAG01_NODE_57833_length_309_cov_4.461905_1_plen_59_part_10